MRPAARDDGGAARDVADPAAPGRQRRVARGVEAAGRPGRHPGVEQRVGPLGHLVQRGEEAGGVEARLAQRLAAAVRVVGAVGLDPRDLDRDLVEEREAAGVAARRLLRPEPRRRLVERQRREVAGRVAAQVRRTPCGVDLERHDVADDVGAVGRLDDVGHHPGARRVAAPDADGLAEVQETGVVDGPGERVDDGEPGERAGVARLVGPGVVERVERGAVDDEGPAAVVERIGAQHATLPRHLAGRERHPGVEPVGRGCRRVDVGPEPGDVGEPAGLEPPDLVVGNAGSRFASLDPAAHDAQDRPVVERPVAVERARDRRDDLDVDAELLAQLAHERRRGILARLHLAAGELPAAGERRRPRPAGGEQPAARLDRPGDDDAPSIGSHVRRLVGGGLGHAATLPDVQQRPGT